MKKYLLLAYTVLSFIGEIILGSYYLINFENTTCLFILLGILALDLSIGGYVMYIVDKNYGGDGYLITVAYGLMVPFAAPLSIYFITRSIKEK